MKIGIGQINTKIGDFSANALKIENACAKLKEMGADFAVFPELSLCGYSPRDYLLYADFVAKAKEELESLAKRIAIPAIVGSIRKSHLNDYVYNSAFWLENGEVKCIADKVLLPTYGIFDEGRTYIEGERVENFIEFKSKKIAITICEDIWSLDFVESAKAYAKPYPLDLIEAADVLLNISASLWTKQNYQNRAKLLPEVAKKLKSKFVFCNLVGSNDESVFDGHSSVFDENGNLLLELNNFQEDFRVIDLDEASSVEPRAFDEFGDLQKALEMSIRDFVRKSGFSKVLLGLSGGIDSALVATLAVGALGKENVMGISLPSKISSEHSKDDAKALADNLGIKFDTIAIADVVESFEKSLKPLFGDLPRSVAEENLQARARGTILMGVSNKLSYMLLTTGNKSESAVGYCTLYGDMCGSYAPIADVYKTDVYSLCRYINRNGEVVPQNTIDKPPSAELSPNQTDQDSLPDYDTLDAVLKLYIEQRQSASQIIERGFKEEVVRDVIAKVLRNEFKRRQSAVTPRLTEVSFGAGRRVPIVYKSDI
ncbi:MAG: NAD+ synthase [Opitutales bacterium]